MKLPPPSCSAHPLMYLQATVLVCCRLYLITSIMCSQCCCLLVQLTGESHFPSLTHAHPRQTHARTLPPVSVPEALAAFSRGETPSRTCFYSDIFPSRRVPGCIRLNSQGAGKCHFGFSEMAQPGGSPDTLAVPPKQLHHGDHVGLNEDLVRILRENLLQQERPRHSLGRRSPSSMSPRLSPTTLSPRNSPRLLRRMLLNNNTHKQRRFTVAHTW